MTEIFYHCGYEARELFALCALAFALCAVALIIIIEWILKKYGIIRPEPPYYRNFNKKKSENVKYN